MTFIYPLMKKGQITKFCLLLLKAFKECDSGTWRFPQQFSELENYSGLPRAVFCFLGTVLALKKYSEKQRHQAPSTFQSTSQTQRESTTLSRDEGVTEPARQALL